MLLGFSWGTRSKCLFYTLGMAPEHKLQPTRLMSLSLVGSYRSAGEGLFFGACTSYSVCVTGQRSSSNNTLSVHYSYVLRYGRSCVCSAPFYKGIQVDSVLSGYHEGSNTWPDSKTAVAIQRTDFHSRVMISVRVCTACISVCIFSIPSVSQSGSCYFVVQDKTLSEFYP